MAITFRATSTGGGLVGGTRAVSKPSGALESDLVLVHLRTDDDVTISAPDGSWTTEASITGTGNIKIFSKVLGASEPSSWTFTFGSSTTSSYGAIAWYSSTATALVTGTAQTQTNGSGTSITYPSIDTVYVDPVLHCFSSQGSGTTDITPDGAMTERYQVNTARTYLMTQNITSSTTTTTGTRTATAASSVTSRCVSIEVAEDVAATPSSITATLTATLDDITLGAVATVAPVVTRVVDNILNVDWDFDDSYTDETANIVSARGSIRLAPPGQNITTSGGMVAQATFELENTDNRFSPLDTSGALYSYIQNGGIYRVPVQFNVSIDGGSNYTTVFQGLAKSPQIATLTPQHARTVNLDCRGNEEQYLNYRINTTQANFKAYHDDGKTESELIEAILLAAGVDGGDMTLDDGLYLIPWFWLDEGSVIEACWQLAAAAGGRFYCDMTGQFVYENATHWLLSPHDTSQETLARSGYADMTHWYDDSNLASKVIVRARQIETGGTGVLWQAGGAITVPANTNKTIVAELSVPAYEIDNVSYVATTTGGADLSGSVSVARTDYAQRVSMTITNAHATSAAVIRFLQINGTGAEDGETISVTQTSGDSFWTAATRTTSSFAESVNNPWIQTEAQADAVAQFVLDRQEVPTLFFQLRDVPGIPTRRPGDRITLNDSVMMSSSREVFILGIDWRYSARTGFRQDLLCIDATNLWPYAAGSWFVLDTSTLDGSDRIFY